MSLGITNVTWSNTHNDSRSSGFKSHLAHFGYPSPKYKNERNPPPPPLLPPSPTKKENLLGNGTFQFTLRQFLILQETETLEKLLIFSSRKLFLYFSIRKTWKSFLYFKKRKPCKNFLYFRKLLSELKIWKNLLLENFLYFSKWSF